MSDIPEAIGTASEGGLFARAISRKNGWRSRKDPAGDTGGDAGHFAEEDCLNCGTHLIGPHCHVCGQQAHLHRTLAAVGHDLLHGVLHLDGKLWRTLPELTLRPGKLTRRYIDGERADFVSPMAMFLFTVFLMFAIFQAIGFTTPTEIGGPNMDKIGEDMTELRGDLVDRRDNLREDLVEAQRPDADPRDAAEVEEIRARMAELDQEIAGIERGRAIIFGNDKEDGQKGFSGGITVGGDSNIPLFEKLNEKWRKNPGLMLYKLQANSYKFSWLLIPLSLPFVWLLFAWRRRFKAYDHAIFVTYSLGFMSLMFIVLSLLGKVGIGLGWLFTAFCTLAPLHIYKHLKHTYGLSRFSAIWRLIVLLVAINVVIVLFLQILLILGAF